jgi:hypothetical protein
MIPRKSDYPNIEVERFFPNNGTEFTYFLKIPFEDIDELKISIANKSMVNLGSGLIRHLEDEEGKVKYPNGVRLVDGKLITDSSAKRIFHWDYDKHMQKLGIKNKNGDVLVPAYMNGWRDLGQNPWHIFWESNPAAEEYISGNNISNGKKKDCLVRLSDDEKYGITRNHDINSGRIYSCFVMPNKGEPHIRRLRINEQHELYTPDLEEKLNDSINWCASGKALLRDGNPIDIYDIVEQYYDVAHIFPVSNKAPEDIDGRTDRIRKGELVQMLYKNYPSQFKNNCIKALKEGLGTGEYYFDIVGVNDDNLMTLHMYGNLKEVASYAKNKGMRDAIIVDEGGSIASWAWYHGPNGGFENCSSYLRTQAIGMFGIKLKH